MEIADYSVRSNQVFLAGYIESGAAMSVVCETGMIVLEDSACTLSVAFEGLRWPDSGELIVTDTVTGYVGNFVRNSKGKAISQALPPLFSMDYMPAFSS